MKNQILNIVSAVILITLSSCSGIFMEEPENNAEAIFENLWTTFNEEYAPFEERNVDWQAQYDLFRPMVTSQTSQDELFVILSDMLTSLDDGHVRLIAQDREIFYSNEIRRNKIDDELFDLQVVKQSYLEPGFKVGEENSFVYGKIKDQNIGYIYFDYVGPNWTELNTFLDQNRTSDGIIIDLRHNKGGDFTWAFAEMSNLVDSERYVFRSKTKNGPAIDDFTQWEEWSVYPGDNYFDKPIILLTDRYTISAGERAVMALNALPNVTTVGDRTNGAQGTMIGRELANGWFYSLVTQKIQYNNGFSYEGAGMPVDNKVINTVENLNNGVDDVMELALFLLN